MLVEYHEGNKVDHVATIGCGRIVGSDVVGEGLSEAIVQKFIVGSIATIFCVSGSAVLKKW